MITKTFISLPETEDTANDIKRFFCNWHWSLLFNVNEVQGELGTPIF